MTHGELIDKLCYTICTQDHASLACKVPTFCRKSLGQASLSHYHSCSQPANNNQISNVFCNSLALELGQRLQNINTAEAEENQTTKFVTDPVVCSKENRTWGLWLLLNYLGIYLGFVLRVLGFDLGFACLGCWVRFRLCLGYQGLT